MALTLRAHEHWRGTLLNAKVQEDSEASAEENLACTAFIGLLFSPLSLSLSLRLSALLTRIQGSLTTNESPTNMYMSGHHGQANTTRLAVLGYVFDEKQAM